jgi:hypothetical protein
MGKASGVFNVPFRGDTWDPTVKNRGKKGPYFRIESFIREMGAGIPPNLYCPEGAVRRPQTVGLKGVRAGTRHMPDIDHVIVCTSCTQKLSSLLGTT